MFVCLDISQDISPPTIMPYPN